MARSMTGFGFGEKTHGEERVYVEMRSVNHRFLDVQFQMPSILHRQEEEAREIIGTYLLRGKVDVKVNTPNDIGMERTLRTDWTLLQRYLQEAERFRQLGHFQENLQLEDFLFHSDIVTVQETPAEDFMPSRAFIEALQAASENLNEMRDHEGRLLQKDLEQHLQDVKQWNESISRRLPMVRSDYEKRLEKRIKELTLEVDEDRLLTEVALFAEKSDVNEEIVRLRSHFHLFETTLQQTGAIGRKLDFIIQEMNREVNTIGAKGNDREVSKHVVEMKSALEKMKEQVQNIE